MAEIGGLIVLVLDNVLTEGLIVIVLDIVSTWLVVEDAWLMELAPAEDVPTAPVLADDIVEESDAVAQSLAQPLAISEMGAHFS